MATADDVADVRALLDLDAEAVERGRTVVVGAGFAPGLSCLLARHAVGSLDEADEIHVAKVGTGGPACAEQHHLALGSDGLDWRDGSWVSRTGGSGRELCWFPEPVGGQRLLPGRRARPAAAGRRLPRDDPGDRPAGRQPARPADLPAAHAPSPAPRGWSGCHPGRGPGCRAGWP